MAHVGVEALCVFGSFALRVHHLGGAGSCSTMKPRSSWKGDRRHAAFAEVAFDPVAVGEGGGEPGGDLGHGCLR